MQMIARFITKRYKFIIAVWALFIILMGVFAIRLPAILEGDGFRMDGEHEDVMELVTESFDVPADTLFLVFENVTDEQIEASLEEVAALELTSAIDSPLDNKAQYKEELAYAPLHFDEDAGDMDEVVTAIRDVTDGEDGVIVTGEAALTKDINAASQQDLMIAEAIGLPIALVILVLAFGTIVASLIPLVIGVSAVIASFGILTIIGGYTDLSIFVLNIIPMLGLALSIDFALLFISRYREEREKTDAAAAVITTIQTAGRSVLFSAFCVFIGLGAMMLVKVDIFHNIGLGGMIVVLMAVLSSVTLLPALLLALGDRIDKWQVFRPKANGQNRWRKFANGVIKRPILITIIAFILLGIASIPVRNIDLTIPDIDALPLSYDSRYALEEMEATFDMTDESSLYIIATRDEGWENTAGLEEMKALEKEFQDDPLVDDAPTIFGESGIDTPEEWEEAWDSPLKETDLEPLWDTFIQGDQLFIPVTLAVAGASDEAQDWVRDLENIDRDADIQAGGEAKFNQEIFDEIADRILLVVTVIMVSTFIVLLIAFRSILIPIKAILMNVIGLAAAFGVLVYIFQYGHFGLAAGTIALIIPVIVFSLVFGLSMDYEVFLITRMQEEYERTGDNDYATVEGLAVTSKIITSAALIMIVLTGAFAFTDVMPVKQIGVGIAIAVAIDATIIRLLLVPSLMKLFGKWNWWLPFRKDPGKRRSQDKT